MRIVVSSSNAPVPVGAYSQGRGVGNTIFLSGQLGIDPVSGQLVEGGIVEEARQALRNISALAESAGTDISGVVKTTIYVTDLSEFGALNELYKSVFTEPYPARSAVQVAALPMSASVEIEAILAL